MDMIMIGWLWFLLSDDDDDHITTLYKGVDNVGARGALALPDFQSVNMDKADVTFK